MTRTGPLAGIPWKSASVGLGLIVLPLVAIAYVAGPWDFHEQGTSGNARISEGERRSVMLGALTSEYVARGERVTAAMREGKALAPVGYLNGELARRKAQFRVTSTQGLSAETYDVS